MLDISMYRNFEFFDTISDATVVVDETPEESVTIRTVWRCIDSLYGALVVFVGVSRRCIAFFCTELSTINNSFKYTLQLGGVIFVGVSQALRGVLLHRSTYE